MKRILSVVIMTAACGSSSSSKIDAATQSPDAKSSTADAKLATADAKPIDATPLDARVLDAFVADSPPPPDAKTGFTLTITNKINWCTVTVDGTTYMPPSDYPPMTYPKDTVVNLSAVPDGPFLAAFWTGTDADSGSGDHHMTATVTMSADKTITVCCPDSALPNC